jgi:hypothetical protein
LSLVSIFLVVREDEAHAEQETSGRRGQHPWGANARRRPTEEVRGGGGGSRAHGYGNWG